MTIRRRAMRDDQKLVRRQAILDTAWQLFLETSYPAITMADVAEQAGLAKGTLYLYFATKEELFLALLETHFTAWFADLEGRLALIGAHGDAQQIGAAVAASLGARPGFSRLLALLHSVLEQNIAVEHVAAFKTMLLEGINRLGTALESCLPSLGPGGGGVALLRIYALIIGLQQLADPAPAAARAMEQHPELAAFRISFESELAAGAEALLEGMLERR